MALMRKRGGSFIQLRTVQYACTETEFPRFGHYVRERQPDAMRVLDTKCTASTRREGERDREGNGRAFLAGRTCRTSMLFDSVRT